MVAMKLLTLALFGSALAAPLNRRQIAGEGSAADSILTGFDNASGYGTENAEDNIANTISGVTGHSSGASSGTNTGANGGGSSSGGAPPPPPPPPQRRQLDKISKGAQAIGNAAGIGDVTEPITSTGETVDGDGTGAAADAGAEIESTEEGLLEGAGEAVP